VMATEKHERKQECIAKSGWCSTSGFCGHHNMQITPSNVMTTQLNKPKSKQRNQCAAKNAQPDQALSSRKGQRAGNTTTN